MFSDTLSLGFGYVTVAKLDDLQTNPLVKRRRPKTVIEQKENHPLAVLCYIICNILFTDFIFNTHPLFSQYSDKKHIQTCFLQGSSNNRNNIQYLGYSTRKLANPYIHPN